MSKKFPMHINNPGTPFTMLILEGKKVFITTDPIHGKKLKPIYISFPGFEVFGVDGFDNLDHGVDFFRIEANAGEMVYIPEGWIHEVRNEEVTLSVLGYPHRPDSEPKRRMDLKDSDRVIHMNFEEGLKRTFGSSSGDFDY